MNLTELLQSTEPTKRLGSYEKLTVDGARRYHGATYSIGMGAGRRFCRHVDLSGRRRLLDIGGGSGAYSINAVQTFAGLDAIVFDLPQVVPVTAEFLERNGVTDLFAMSNLATGEVVHQLRPQHRAIEFRPFLDTIDATVPEELDGHLILDNASTHKTPANHKWLLRHPRFTFHFIPTSSSWLNLVERCFAQLTNRMLKRSTHRSVNDLTNDLNHWIATRNEKPPPYA